MGLRANDRGQSIQIGAVLLFGVLVLLLASYQAMIVPDQNRKVEANHVETVGQQLVDLRNAIVSLPGRSTGRSVTVTLGVSYPARAIAINPPSPTGVLRTVGTTSDDVNVTVANARALDSDADDYWDGRNRSYTDGAIEYRPGYNEYRNPPTTVYENSVLVDTFDDGQVTRSSQRLIDGRRLSVVTVNGSVNAGGSDARSVDVAATSSSDRQITLTNEPGESIVLNVASQFDARWWEAELRDQGEFEDQGGYVVSVTETPRPDAPFDVVHLELAPDETYDLRMAKAGIGSGVTAEDVAYLISETPDGTTVQQGQSTTITLETRDRYNNPESGVLVSGDAGSGSLTPADARTREDGRATFEYTAPTDTTGDVDVDFSYDGPPSGDFDETTPEDVSVRVSVTAGSDSSPSPNAPEIDQFDVEETPRNNQAQFDVDWGVSDGNGDLDTVTVTMTAEDGTEVDSATIDVSGGSASGTETFRQTGNPPAQTYTFDLTVSDEAGNSASDSQDVAYSGN